MKNNILKKFDLEDDGYFLFIGVFRKYKGIDLLIIAFKSFSENHPNHRLLIVGECYDDWKIISFKPRSSD